MSGKFGFGSPMAAPGIEEIEKVVRAEIAAQSNEVAPETLADRWRAMTHWVEASGTPGRRLLFGLERLARRALGAIRRLRSR